MTEALPYYEVHGTRGPYLLLIHGMLSSRSQWLLNLPALAEMARPIVLELWGHGRSDSPESLDLYRRETYLEMIEQIRQDLGIDSWFVCGQSFGATISIRYALTYPERVQGQIFTNSRSAISADRASLENQPFWDEEANKVLKGGLHYLEQMRIHPKHARHMPEEAKKALLEDAQLLNPFGISQTYRTFPGASVKAMLSQNTVPALLVCGALEKIFAPCREDVEKEMPHLEIVDTQAGHAVNIQAASMFNKAVTDFLNAHNH